jgi:rhodanese-related sulfurtransferase
MTKKHDKPKERSGSRRRPKHRRQTSFATWNWVFIGLAVLVVAVLVVFATNRTSDIISPAEAYARYQQGALILDVRTQEEYDQVHIPGSTLIPLDELPYRSAELPTNQEIIVVCLKGKRSQEGMQILQEAGFKQVSCLDGGLEAWVNAGYPTEP